MSRSSAILALAAFVIALGVGALLVTGGIGHAVPKSPPHLSAPLSAVKLPPFCSAQQIELIGSRTDCATKLANGAACSVAGGVFDAVIRLDGNTQRYVLYVEVDGGYSGTGPYLLLPWPHPYPDAHDGNGKAGVREFVSGTLWHSVAGVIIVTNKDGKSGVINADLDRFGGAAAAPTTRLHIEGPWSCA